MYRPLRRHSHGALTPEEIEVKMALFHRYTFTEDKADFVPTHTLFRVYRRYRRGEGKPKLSRNSFGIALRYVFGPLRVNPDWRVRRNGVMGFCYMKRIPNAPYEAPASAPEVRREPRFPEDADDKAIMA